MIWGMACRDQSIGSLEPILRHLHKEVQRRLPIPLALSDAHKGIVSDRIRLQARGAHLIVQLDGFLEKKQGRGADGKPSR